MRTEPTCNPKPIASNHDQTTILKKLMYTIHALIQKLPQYLLPSLNTSPYSSKGLRISLVSFHKFGVRNPYELPTAMKVAFNVFSSVLVEPDEDV